MGKTTAFCAFLLTLLVFPPFGTAQESFELRVFLNFDSGTNIFDLDWSFDSTLLAFVDRNDIVSIVDVKTVSGGSPLSRVEDEIYVLKAVAWRTNHYQLLIANNLTKIWNYSENKWLDDFEVPSAIKFEAYTTEGNVDWRPDGSQFSILLRGCEEGTPYRPGARVEVWDVTSSTFFQIAGCVWTPPFIAKWNPQGTQLAITGFAVFDEEGFVKSEEIEIWNVDTRERLLAISGLKDPSGLDWSPDGDMIAFTTIIGVDQFLQVRDVTNGEIISQAKANLAVYVPLDWHPSENLIATGGQDGSVRIWDALTGSELIELPVHEDTVQDVSWSPDGSRLASAGRDGQLFIWNVLGLQN